MSLELNLHSSLLAEAKKMLNAMDVNFIQDNERLILSPSKYEKNINEDWINLFATFLPTIVDSYNEFDESRPFHLERDPNRTFMHTMTKEEFILVALRHFSKEKLLSMGKTLSSPDRFEKFLSMYEEYPDWELEIIISAYLISPFISYLKLRDEKVGMLFGDVICFSFLDYRDDGIFIYYQDNSAIPLESKPDDYGTLPRLFPAFTEFPPEYFINAIGHNSYIWIPKSIPRPKWFTGAEAEDMIKQEFSEWSIEISEYVNYTDLWIVEYNNKKYYIIFGYDKEDAEKNEPYITPERILKYGDYGEVYTEDPTVITINFRIFAYI